MGQMAPGKRVRAKKHPFLSMALTLAASLLLVVVVLINLFTHVFPVVRYYGDGMEPTLHSGQLLILLKTEKVQEGDVIAFYYNNKVLVRRVICEGGQQIAIDPTGTVYINGTAQDEPYVEHPSIGQCNLKFPYYVPLNHVFVMGDRRETAMDSRLEEIGPIPSDRILGKVLLSI